MPTRTSSARWQGDLKGGSGSLALGSGAFEGQYSFKSRFEEGTGTNPEELIAAAHAACYSMALSNMLAGAGFPPDSVQTNATVHFVQTEGEVPGIDEATFLEAAEKAKETCPISTLLKPGLQELTLDAKFVS